MCRIGLHLGSFWAQLDTTLCLTHGCIERHILCLVLMFLGLSVFFVLDYYSNEPLRSESSPLRPTRSGTLLHSDNQLLPTNLTLPHGIHTLQHALKPLPILIQANLMNFQLPLLEQLPTHLPEHLPELEILRHRRELLRPKLKKLANYCVCQCMLELNVWIYFPDIGFRNWEKCRVDAA